MFFICLSILLKYQPLEGIVKIGNIRDFNYDFKKLWMAKKASEERSFIRDTKCFCTHECFNIVNIMFNPKFYPKLLFKSKEIKD